MGHSILDELLRKRILEYLRMLHSELLLFLYFHSKKKNSRHNFGWKGSALIRENILCSFPQVSEKAESYSILYVAGERITNLLNIFVYVKHCDACLTLKAVKISWVCSKTHFTGEQKGVERWGNLPKFRKWLDSVQFLSQPGPPACVARMLCLPCGYAVAEQSRGELVSLLSS